VISAPGKCAITIHSKERNITADVTKCCNEEAGQKFLSVSVTKATARAAEHGNKSVSTRQCIRNKSNNCTVDSVLTTPRKAKKWPTV
jgi:hypothetical protein